MTQYFVEYVKPHKYYSNHELMNLDTVVEHELKRCLYKIVYFNNRPLTYKGTYVYSVDSLVNKSKLIKRWTKRSENIHKPDKWAGDFKHLRRF